MDLGEFLSGQKVWLDWLTAQAGVHQLKRRFNGLRHLGDIECALVATHIGLGHMLGVADADLAIEDVIAIEDVTDLISRWWRAGAADPLTTSEIICVWIALFQLSRDHGAVEVRVLKAIVQSQTGLRMQSITQQDLGLEVRDYRGLALLLEGVDSVEISRLPGRVFPWEGPGAHLAKLRGVIYSHELAEVSGKVSLLEITAALGASEIDLIRVEDLKIASRVQHVYLSVPGAWPGPAANDIPDWVRDVVTVRGARMYQSSTGFVPGWLVVVESEEELAAVNRWGYNQVFCLPESGTNELVIGVVLEFGPNDNAVLSYRYPLNDVSHTNWLKTILALAVVRFEIYRLGLFGELSYVATMGVHLPPELVNLLRQAIAATNVEDVSSFHSYLPSDWLKVFGHTEWSTFETLSICQPEFDASTAIGGAYRHYLKMMDASGRQHLLGSTPDLRLLEEAQRTLRLEISKRGSSDAAAPLDLSVLGDRRGVVQFRVTLDEPASLRANVAFLDENGSEVAETFEFSATISLNSTHKSIDDLCAYLTVGLEPLREIQRRGVSSLVVAAGAGIYHLPFHEALLALDFEEVTYTHRLSTLKPKPRDSPDDPPLVAGSPGVGDQKLDLLDIELQTVSEINGAEVSVFAAQRLPRIVHLAGHAVTGSRDYEVGMWATAEYPLTPSRVLLDIDANSCDLVYLSACSTGTGEFNAGEVIGAVPLDVAFIEKGAKVVISTLAPINDQVAAFFACVFHAAYAASGDVWRSYLVAREASASGELPSVLDGLQRMLAERWPSWHSDMANRLRRSPGDWKLLRISGRHW